MVLLLNTALAAAYDCPAVNLPSEALVIYPGDLEGLFTEIDDWTKQNWDAECIADCVDMGEFDICKEADCVTDEGVSFTFRTTEDTEDATTISATTITLGVDDDSLAWDNFYFSRVVTDETVQATGDTYLTHRWEASWEGALPNLPSDFDGLATQVASTVYASGSVGESREFQDDTCYWRWTHDVYSGDEIDFYGKFEEWGLTTFATELKVEHTLAECDASYGGAVTAVINTEYIGQIDETTWDFIGVDDDGDGWSVEGGDPNDDDSFVTPCSQEEVVGGPKNTLCGVAGAAGAAPLMFALLAVSRRRR